MWRSRPIAGSSRPCSCPEQIAWPSTINCSGSRKSWVRTRSIEVVRRCRDDTEDERTTMIIKQNRGRQWLDWQRRMVTGAHYVGAGACLLLLIALVFGDMG